MLELWIVIYLNLSSWQTGPDNRAQSRRQRSEGYLDLNKYNYYHYYDISLWFSVTDIMMQDVIDFLRVQHKEGDIGDASIAIHLWTHSKVD